MQDDLEIEEINRHQKLKIYPRKWLPTRTHRYLQYDYMLKLIYCFRNLFFSIAD